MILKSSYKDGDRLPAKYANLGPVGGENISPPFQWEDAPHGTKSFCLAMIDHHPVANHFVHWLVIDIPADVFQIAEGASGAGKMPSGAYELATDYGQPGYGGGRPPAGTGYHGYETTVWALDVASLELGASSNFAQYEKAITGKALAKATLTGLFSQ
ncbi:MAG: YbhB/YbcL family Raf kinase inhibitor-like protein [Actinomycetia bacterium]|nr:YbhB/YbcL family Raf kinase inhibitor-like protein [Actinomycetes bacterium]